LSVLARGGYSTVYRARQDSIGREVALKIDTRALESERDRRRFLREAEAAGRMSGHPNVVNVYDAGVTEDNHPYLVMELCTGGSYATRLRQNGPLSPAEVREVGVKIADALQAAHENGILHRDVKPGNILINRYGVPGLADFGLAALPDPGRELSVTIEALTPAYAPPEVFRMETPSPLGDQYALGATMYALLSGRPPRWPETGTPSLATMVMLLDDPVPDIPGIPAGLSNVLRQAMAAYAEDRYASAAEFRDALAALDLSSGSGGPLPPPPVGGPPVSVPYASWGASATPPPQHPVSGAPSSGTPMSGMPMSGMPSSAVPSQSSGPPSSGPPYRGVYGSPVTGPTTGGGSYGGWHQGPPGPPPSSPATVFPSTTFGPSAPQAGFGHPGAPPAPPPAAPQRGPQGGSRRGVALVGVIAAALVVVVGLGVAIAAFVSSSSPGDSDRGPRPPGSSFEPGDGPQSTTQPDGNQQGATPAPSQLPDGLPFNLPSTATKTATSPCEAASAAASLSSIPARCPAKPECWTGRPAAGLLTAQSCTRKHTWETYVIGTLNTKTTSTTRAAVEADPNVQAMCTSGVLGTLLSIAGEDATGWKVAVVVPKAAPDLRPREFSCVAGKTGLTNAVFVK
jgi:serine/threonine protein kinase